MQMTSCFLQRADEHQRDSVSYTHLDVYKRQQVKTMDKAAAIEAGLYNVISDEVEDCLLYTSI